MQEVVTFNKILHLIPGTLPLAAFPHLDQIGMENLLPFMVQSISCRIRVARKTLATSFAYCSSLYYEALREHGPIIALFNRFLGKSDNWDTLSYIHSLDGALSLNDVKCSQRSELAGAIEALDCNEENFQSRVAAEVVRVCFPFCLGKVSL